MMALFYGNFNEFDRCQTIEEAIYNYIWDNAFNKTISDEILTLEERTVILYRDKRAAHDYKLKLMAHEIEKIITPSIMELLNKQVDQVFLKYFSNAT